MKKLSLHLALILGSVATLTACGSDASPPSPQAAGAPAASGGTATGGATVGGSAAGAAVTGGTATGGMATGGAANGGASNAGQAGAGESSPGGTTGGGVGGTTPEGGATAGGNGGSPTGTGALHVNGGVLNDGNNQKIAFRGPELVIRWGVYAGILPTGVDVPWEGGANHDVGAAQMREIAKTKANALRILGGKGGELDAILKTAIVEQKMYVGVGRVDWTNPDMMAVLKKYEKYIFIHPRGEFTHHDPELWRTEALTVVKYIRGLGYTSPIELGTTGYGQTWSTIKKHGKEVADSDPLKNTFFLLQLYSELAKEIPATLSEIEAFGYPVTVDACLFTSTYGNTPNTYKEVWDQAYAKGFGSFYWDWWGDGEGNSMTSNGNFTGLNAIGQYIVNDSPAALKNTVKTPFLLNATVP